MDTPVLPTRDPVRVAVHDVVPAYSCGLVAALRQGDYEAEEFADVAALMRALEESPSIVLFSVRDEATWSFFDELAHRYADSKFIAILSEPSLRLFHRALRAGAQAALPQNAPLSDIVMVVEGASADKAVLPADIAIGLASAITKLADHTMVSEIEERWLRDICRGATVTVIARKEGYSEREMHRLLHALYNRLGVAGRAEAIAVAAQWGLV